MSFHDFCCIKYLAASYLHQGFYAFVIDIPSAIDAICPKEKSSTKNPLADLALPILLEYRSTIRYKLDLLLCSEGALVLKQEPDPFMKSLWIKVQ